jgi:N-acetylglucosaminyl-diphospho-decaprenol L-rhamnosyltransferase
MLACARTAATPQRTRSDPQALRNLRGMSSSGPVVDAVIVSYRSAETLRDCVLPLAAMADVHTTVVDNASPDDALATVADLPVEVIRAPRNGGFSYGCNIGASGGDAPFLLFLNPDARIDAEALHTLLVVMREHPETGLVAPRIREPSGALAFSLRRFPRLRSTYAQACFLHRLRPAATWADELIRDRDAYERAATAEWVSGACMLMRRDAYDSIGGFDERFFLYCEDTDVCRTLWNRGWSVRYEPGAEVRHVGGASSGAGETQAIAARSRVLYARKHRGRLSGLAERLGVALGEVTHAAVKLRRPASRRGHMAALRAALSPATSTTRR